MLKQATHTIGVQQHSDKANDHSHTQGNIKQSVFHTLILPLGLSLASIQAGIIYFILVIGAYSTIFRDKSYYVFLIMKFVGALAAVAIAWVSMFYVFGHVGAMI